MIAPPRLPSHDELEALIREARARQLRRRLLGAAGVAIAAAIALSLYAFASDPGKSSTGTRSAGTTSAPVCRGDQLSATTFLQAATMSGVGPITIRNLSGAACRLPQGTPSVRITWRGSTLRVQERLLGRQGQPVHLLRPGAKAAVPLMWSNWCRSPQGMARLVFYARFANGLEVRAPETRSTGHPACNVRSAPSVLSVGKPIRT